MHKMFPFFFGWLHCPTCGRMVIPVGPNPLKWWVVIPGEGSANHTGFNVEVLK